ncbi:hypothetical protein PR048_019670 [Dryococelus australis]|uniref:Uncharacterized protein n=1 Tax=Dryococelus australis TaxID=614101 RepID=A0ABQ9H428_9NEOP|nr:hypothetical protein PR048_019670 [Dryococelus australis]
MTAPKGTPTVGDNHPQDINEGSSSPIVDTYDNHHHRNLQAAERSNVHLDSTPTTPSRHQLHRSPRGSSPASWSQLSWRSTLDRDPRLTQIHSCSTKEADEPSSDAVLDGGANISHLDRAEVPDPKGKTQGYVQPLPLPAARSR